MTNEKLNPEKIFHSKTSNPYKTYYKLRTSISRKEAIFCARCLVRKSNISFSCKNCLEKDQIRERRYVTESMMANPIHKDWQMFIDEDTYLHQKYGYELIENKNGIKQYRINHPKGYY
jgi:hypothetical protein